MGAETDVVEPMSSDDVVAADNETADEPSRDQQRKRKKLLYKSIQDLMEFYLGDVNISKNRFIFQHIQGKPFVYMDLSIFLTFNKIKALTSNVEDIAKAIANSELLEVSKDGTHVCRKTPILKKENEDQCTLYVEQLSPEVDLDTLMRIFSEFGPVDYVSMPKFARSNKFKGFAFVEFRDPESAMKAIEVLSSRGCCLSPHMAPEDLMSIKTFDPNKENNNKNLQNKKIKFENDTEEHAESEVSDKNANENNSVDKKSNKLKRKLSDETNDKESETTNNEEPTSKKGKKKRKSSESEESSRKQAKTSEVETKETDESQTSTSKSNKRKHSVDEPEQTSEPVEKKSKHNDGADEESEESKMEDGEEAKEKKKRKKRKKVKKDRASAVSLGLKVLSKLEWKQLRNKYLNMQRDTMRSLKQQLSYSRREMELTKKEERINNEPGTVVKITLEEPITNAKAAKNEMRVHPEIRYVDVTEGSSVVYLRTSTSELASSLMQSKHWPTMEIISGEEETEYWNKMKRDRKEHFNKVKPNCRGRTKLLKKAERIQGANTFEASASQS